jgi:poly(3-hydroxyalkanoate) synthetase
VDPRPGLGAHDDDHARNLRIWNDFLLHLWDPSYLERQRLISRWLNDLVPFPGEAYRQFVKELVQANKLVRGELLIDGNAADASQITCPVLVLAHTGDVLAPPESAQALLEVVSSADREAVTVSGGTLGHVDIVVGPEGPAIMWLKLTAWLETRSGAGRQEAVRAPSVVSAACTPPRDEHHR